MVVHASEVSSGESEQQPEHLKLMTVFHVQSHCVVLSVAMSKKAVKRQKGAEITDDPVVRLDYDPLEALPLKY